MGGQTKLHKDMPHTIAINIPMFRNEIYTIAVKSKSYILDKSKTK